MSHVVKNLNWGVIDVDLDAGSIFFQQRWKYTWNVKTPMRPWSLDERRRFHNTVDRQIWGSWSNRVRFGVAGTAPFCRRFSAAGVPMNMDIRWVVRDEHWNVSAWKLPPGVFEHSTVDFAGRRIRLNNNTATTTRTACNNATPAVCQPGFRSSTHEFGHTIDAPDEYTAASPHLADTHSIMNIGQQLRKRHFELILAELNTMITGCAFTIRSIRN